MYALLQAPPAQTVQGVVRDQTGAVLQGARVELTDESGASAGTTTTDVKGTYALAAPRPGSYQLTVRFEGFRPGVVRIRVVAGRTPAPQVVVLELASVPQEVTVSGGEAISAAANANRDAIMLDDHALNDLPVFDRNLVATMARMLDAATLGTGGVTLVVDGMEARKVGVSPSAIQQVKLNQDPYSAEFPRPGRGRIEVITKAGTDRYSGSVDFTFRDAALNARDPFAETKPPEQRRIFEGVFGGPVGDGKRGSFLFTLERRDEDLQAVVVAAGPAGPINAVVAAPDRGVEVSASINHQVGKPHTIQVRFTAENSDTRNQGVGGVTLPEAGSNDSGDEAQIIVGGRSVLTAHLLNEFRVLAGREVGSSVSINAVPRIVVLDAFTGGSAQSDQRTTEYHTQVTESLTYLHGKHLVKTGFAIPDFSRRGFDDRTNFAGTFTFSTLDDYTAGRPLSFVQQRGDGQIVFLQKVFGAFAQDEIAVNRRLTLTPGVRYDWQNVFTDNNNVAPRMSAAVALDAKTALRGGVGVFYDRAGDGPIRDVLRSRQQKLVRYVVLDPGYPDPVAAGSAGSPPPSLVTLAPDLQTPSTIQFGIGIERLVRKGTTVAVNYLGTKGVDLFRSIDVNAPPPPLYAARPDPAFGQTREIASTGRQTADSLQVLARGRFLKRLQGTVQYTLSSAHNDTSGINSLPANNYDLAAEWGRADFDSRHHLEALLTWKAGVWADFGLAVSLASGRPYSLRTGLDDYNTGQTNARPSGVARNTLDGPGLARVDMHWSHAFAVGASAPGADGRAFRIGVDAFNLLNQVNYAAFVGNLRSPFFGQATAALPPRQIQLTAGYSF